MFVIAPNWKQPKCPLIDECTSKLRYIYTVEYSLAIKRNKLLIYNRMNESQNNYAEFSVCNCENSLLYLKMCLFHIHAWKNIFSGNRILSWQLSFNSLRMCFYCVLASIVSVEVSLKSNFFFPLKSSHSVVSRLFATPWTVTYQAPSSMGFSRQEY